MKRHDHRQSLWIIAGGYILWCYQCGAYKPNVANGQRGWTKPVGIGGENPAMKEFRISRSSNRAPSE
jgi:hypothetical protein